MSHAILLHLLELICFSCFEMYAYIFYPDFMYVKVDQSFPTLCDPVDYTVHGIL